MPAIQSSGKKGFIDGYIDNKNMSGDNNLSSPSVNVNISKVGTAEYRKGFIPVDFDLDETGKTSRPFHVKRYDVTFFAINGSVLFVNHNDSDAVVDTGITLTETDGRNTRFGEYAGDIYLTNRKDGLRQIHMGKVNQTDAESGDATITIDQDLAGRLNAFSDTAGTLRIANSTPIAELYTGAAVTGVVTLTNTLDADVADNTIVYTVEDISSGRPFASGITFWKERMILWGVTYDTAVYAPTNLVYMSSFALISGGDGTALANIIDFVTTNTAAKEMVGKGGVVTNVLSTRDYMYVFTETETYFASEADVNLTTGGTPPQLLNNQYGCVNEDCSADAGNGLALFLTNNNRVMGIRISSESGAPVVFPDEKFDSAISDTLQHLDADQSNSFFFYAPSDHRVYVHCDVDSERLVLKYNTEIRAWEPPNTGWSFGGMYVKDSVTYATELTDDSVWQLGEGFQDDGIEYEAVAALSLIESETTLRLESVKVKGCASELATVTVENYVNEGTPQQKSFTTPIGASIGSLGSVTLGATTLGAGIGTDLTPYNKLYGIYPRIGESYQLVVRSLGAFTLESYTVMGSVFRKPLLTMQ
jgi:hypothetical protein